MFIYFVSLSRAKSSSFEFEFCIISINCSKSKNQLLKKGFVLESPLALSSFKNNIHFCMSLLNLFTSFMVCLSLPSYSAINDLLHISSIILLISILSWSGPKVPRHTEMHSAILPCFSTLITFPFPSFKSTYPSLIIRCEVLKHWACESIRLPSRSATILNSFPDLAFLVRLFFFISKSMIPFVASTTRSASPFSGGR